MLFPEPNKYITWVITKSSPGAKCTWPKKNLTNTAQTQRQIRVGDNCARLDYGTKCRPHYIYTSTWYICFTLYASQITSYGKRHRESTASVSISQCKQQQRSHGLCNKRRLYIHNLGIGLNAILIECNTLQPNPLSMNGLISACWQTNGSARNALVSKVDFLFGIFKHRI